MNNKRKRTVRRNANPAFAETVGPAMRELLDRITPPEEARRHFQAARVEMLKGLRSLIDARIAHFSKGSRKGEKIEVE